jgi:hypothetical protein
LGPSQLWPSSDARSDKTATSFDINAILLFAVLVFSIRSALAPMGAEVRTGLAGADDR